MSERWVHVPSHLWNRYPPPEELVRREHEVEMRRQIDGERQQRSNVRMFETLILSPIRAVRRFFGLKRAIDN